MVGRGDKESEMKTRVCTQHSVRSNREEASLLGEEGVRDGLGERCLSVGTWRMIMMSWGVT